MGVYSKDLWTGFKMSLHWVQNNPFFKLNVVLLQTSIERPDEYRQVYFPLRE